MIGNMYITHMELPASKIAKEILLEEDRQKKRINVNVNKKLDHNTPIKNVILSVLADKFYTTNIYGTDGIRIKCGLKEEDDNCVSMTADHAFMLGEMDVIKRIAEETYKELKEKQEC